MSQVACHDAKPHDIIPISLVIVLAALLWSLRASKFNMGVSNEPFRYIFPVGDVESGKRSQWNN